MTQLMRKDCVHHSRRRSLIEFTTSGMTHSWGSLPEYRNGIQKATLLDHYKKFIATSIIRLAHFAGPWTDVVDSNNPNLLYYENGGGEGSKSGVQTSLEKNFGELEFDWDERTVTIRSIGDNPFGPPLIMAKYGIEQLSGRDPMPGVVSTKAFPAGDDWVCINHRGHDNSTFRHAVGHVVTFAALMTLGPLPVLIIVVLGLVPVRRWSKTKAGKWRAKIL